MQEDEKQMGTNSDKQTKQYFYENLQFEHDYSITSTDENLPTQFPTHWHTVGEIVSATRDDSIFNVQGKEYRLNKGDILFIWPGELHATIRVPPEPYLMIQFYNSLLDVFPDMSLLKNEVFSRHYLPGSEPNSPAAEIIGYMKEIKQTNHRDIPLNNIRMSLSLYHMLLAFYDYCRNSKESSVQNAKGVRLHTLETIAQACCYISENCSRELSLDEVAEHVGLSRFHFSRSFKAYTQSNFSDYLAKQRIQKAILLFKNPDISIAEAAFSSGFGSIASFNRCFKKEKNCTPSEYRNLFQSNS